MKKACGLIILFLAVFPTFACAAVRLPAIISDHMVLQAGMDIPIWGWAGPGEKVEVSFAGQKVSTTASANGSWRVKLAALKKSFNPQTLTVRGANTLEVSDVLVGEVWHGSGQSNMEMQLKGLHGQVDNAEAEIAAANHPTLRLFTHEDGHIYSIYRVDVPPDKPDADRPGRWIVCSPETAAKFPAIGYYFGLEIQKEVNVPFGFVHTAVGGTPISAWVSLPAQEKTKGWEPSFVWNAKQIPPNYDPIERNKAAEKARQDWLVKRKAALDAGKPAPRAPGVFRNQEVIYKNAGMFNGMVAPVIPYAVRGVLWYQGERDALYQTAGYYGLQMETLIKDWRALWGYDMYFIWVQLPESRPPQKLPSEHKAWGVLLREKQAQALRLPKTGMAVTLGLGDEKNGHPTNKADYAHRLALIALHDVYSKPAKYWMAPMYKSAEFKNDRVVISFDHADGLRPAGGDLKGFAIAGDDREFVWADARIEKGKVIVSSPSVKKPAAVRYAWATNPAGNLANGGGFLAAPFRTDDWE